MELTDLIQGTDEWLAARAEPGIYTSSDAAASLGLDPNVSRPESLHRKALGAASTESDSFTTRVLFPKGREIEQAARPRIEADLGMELFPVVMRSEIDGIPLLYSSDGWNHEHGGLIWECKQWNAGLVEHLGLYNNLPDSHWPQVEFGLLVSEAAVAVFTVSDGTHDLSIRYTSHPDRRARLIAGIKQFEVDRKAYQHTEIEVAPTPAAVIGMPALFVQIEGRVVATNLPAFREHAAAYLDRLPNPDTLETDQDFADAAAAVKDCKETVDRIKLVKRQAQAQAASIDELFTALDEIMSKIGRRGLDLDKRVAAVKDSRRAALVSETNAALAAHVKRLNERLGAEWVRGIDGHFGVAIKGQRFLSAMQDRLNGALANAKIEASATADIIEINRNMLIGFSPDAVNWMHLFPDFASVCTKLPEDFAALLAMRQREAEKREEELRRDFAAAQQAEEARLPKQTAAPEIPKPPSIGRESHPLDYEAELRLYADINSSITITLGIGPRELSEAEINTILNALQEFMAVTPEDEGMGVR
jgi:predicted phage-related endonuclease